MTQNESKLLKFSKTILYFKNYLKIDIENCCQDYFAFIYIKQNYRRLKLAEGKLGVFYFQAKAKQLT